MNPISRLADWVEVEIILEELQITIVSIAPWAKGFTEAH
jgi:hypothetical protein